MAGQRAIDLALDLARMPTLAAVMRKQPVPSDLLDVIRIAAGCPETSKAAVAASQMSPRAVQAAAVLYLEEILFFHGADLYRNLGVSADAPKVQMRIHMRWLLQWLHPDHNPDEKAALLALRVIGAWHELGRRQRPVCDIQLPPASRPSAPSNRRRPATIRIRWIPVPIPSVSYRRTHGRRMLARVLAAAVALAALLVPDAVLMGWLPGAELAAASAPTQSNGAIMVDVTRK